MHLANVGWDGVAGIDYHNLVLACYITGIARLALARALVDAKKKT